MKGRKMYVPGIVIKELECISAEDDISKKAFAFEKLAKYSQVGREAKHIAKLRWPSPGGSKIKWQ